MAIIKINHVEQFWLVINNNHPSFSSVSAFFLFISVLPYYFSTTAATTSYSTYPFSISCTILSCFLLRRALVSLHLYELYKSSGPLLVLLSNERPHSSAHHRFSNRCVLQLFGDTSACSYVYHVIMKHYDNAICIIFMIANISDINFINIVIININIIFLGVIYIIDINIIRMVIIIL